MSKNNKSMPPLIRSGALPVLATKKQKLIMAPRTKKRSLTNEEAAQHIGKGMMRQVAENIFLLADEQNKMFPDLQMTAVEYAERRGITRQGVTRQLGNKKQLPAVKYYRPLGEGYLLHVCSEEIPKGRVTKYQKAKP